MNCCISKTKEGRNSKYRNSTKYTLATPPTPGGVAPPRLPQQQQLWRLCGTRRGGATYSGLASTILNQWPHSQRFGSPRWSHIQLITVASSSQMHPIIRFSKWDGIRLGLSFVPGPRLKTFMSKGSSLPAALANSSCFSRPHAYSIAS